MFFTITYSEIFYYTFLVFKALWPLFVIAIIVAIIKHYINKT